MAPDDEKKPAPFNVLRAAFLLLAIVILGEMGMTLVSAIGCVWLVLNGRFELGSCASIGQIAREIFAELLTAILALLLAARTEPPKPPE